MQPYPYTSYTPGQRQSAPAAQPARAVPKTVLFAPTDFSAVVVAGVGLAVVLTSMLPAGLITAPITFAKCRRFEAGVAQGRYNPRDGSHFVVARILAWISLVLSLPSVLFGALLVVMLAS